MDDRAPHYLLGHDERELRRLDLQGRLYRAVTLRAFREAGIEPGMRVLDIGCGSGDVSLLAAEVVGGTGEVVGVDRGAAAIDSARRKASTLGVDNVSFRRGEIEELEDVAGFDALVGRFVLMHQADPAAVLATGARAVRSGGKIVMIESWMELIRARHSEPPSRLYDEIVRFKCEVVRRAGADIRAGGRLRSVFVEAGLPAPTCGLDARLEGGSESDYYEYVAESVRSMLTEARRTGVPGFEEVEAVDSLAGRLRDEVTETGGTLVVWPVVHAAVRVP